MIFIILGVFALNDMSMLKEVMAGNGRRETPEIDPIRLVLLCTTCLIMTLLLRMLLEFLCSLRFPNVMKEVGELRRKYLDTSGCDHVFVEEDWEYRDSELEDDDDQNRDASNDTELWIDCQSSSVPRNEIVCILNGRSNQLGRIRNKTILNRKFIGNKISVGDHQHKEALDDLKGERFYVHVGRKHLPENCQCKELDDANQLTPLKELRKSMKANNKKASITNGAYRAKKKHMDKALEHVALARMEAYGINSSQQEIIKLRLARVRKEKFMTT